MDRQWNTIEAQIKFMNWLIDQVNYSYMYWETSPASRDYWEEKPYFDRTMANDLARRINDSFHSETSSLPKDPATPK